MFQRSRTYGILDNHKKTAKTITAQSDFGEIKTVKIRNIDGCECAKMSEGFGYIRA